MTVRKTTCLAVGETEAKEREIREAKRDKKKWNKDKNGLDQGQETGLIDWKTYQVVEEIVDCHIFRAIFSSVGEMQILGTAYHATYGRDLSTVTRSDLSSKTERLFNIALVGNRNEGEYVDQGQVQSDVNALHKAGMGRMGTDKITMWVFDARGGAVSRLCSWVSYHIDVVLLFFARLHSYAHSRTLIRRQTIQRYDLHNVLCVLN